MGFKGNYENIHMQQTHNWIGNYCKTYFASPLFPMVRVTPGPYVYTTFLIPTEVGQDGKDSPFKSKAYRSESREPALCIALWDTRGNSITSHAQSFGVGSTDQGQLRGSERLSVCRGQRLRLVGKPSPSGSSPSGRKRTELWARE